MDGGSNNIDSSKVVTVPSGKESIRDMMVSKGSK